jgi:hypothetical protein
MVVTKEMLEERLQELRKTQAENEALRDRAIIVVHMCRGAIEQVQHTLELLATEPPAEPTAEPVEEAGASE